MFTNAEAINAYMALDVLTLPNKAKVNVSAFRCKVLVSLVHMR
jgi:hypothetical protein